jgi:hypothetical protein
MATVVSLYLAFGEDCVSQSMAVMIGTSQLLLFLAGAIVNPVLCRRTQKQKSFATAELRQVGDCWVAQFLTAMSRQTTAYHFIMFVLSVASVLQCARWLRQISPVQSALFVAAAAFLLGGVAREIKTFSQREKVFQSESELVKPCGEEVYGHTKGECPYTQAFWLDGSQTLEDQDDAVPEPVDLLGDVYLSML